MSFQAYIDNVETRTGKSADALKAVAIGKGLADESGLAPGVKATAVVDWLKRDFDLGHGHAMSIVAYFKGKRPRVRLRNKRIIPMTYRPTLPSFARRASGSAIAMAALAAATLLAVAPAPLHAQTPAPAAAATAAKTGYANVDGARIYYQVHGDLASGRTPLLVLHGAFMSGDAMAPLIAPLAATRPVIAIDARGHGRTGDAPGGLSYDQMANDAAGVLAALKVEKADVLGYSMGAATALRLAMLHPERTAKQVIISGAYRLDGMPPELIKNIASLTPEIFAGSPIESGYKKLSPTPDAFPTLVAEIKALDAADFAWPEDQIRAIKGKTMVVAGDNDGTTLEHTIALFKLRGGYDLPTILQGFMTEAPKARLAILPATSHIGIMAEAPGIAAMVTPFLDDKAPPPPSF